MVVEAATICRALLTDSTIVAASLERAGWKDVTPSMNGMSMAAMTGSTQFRKGRDEALVSGEGAMVGPNCQFTFARISDTEHTEILHALSADRGADGEPSNGGLTWNSGDETLFVRRAVDALTMLWLPNTKEAE